MILLVNGQPCLRFMPCLRQQHGRHQDPDTSFIMRIRREYDPDSCAFFIKWRVVSEIRHCSGTCGGHVEEESDLPEAHCRIWRGQCNNADPRRRTALRNRPPDERVTEAAEAL